MCVRSSGASRDHRLCSDLSAAVDLGGRLAGLGWADLFNSVALYTRTKSQTIAIHQVFKYALSSCVLQACQVCQGRGGGFEGCFHTAASRPAKPADLKVTSGTSVHVETATSSQQAGQNGARPSRAMLAMGGEGGATLYRIDSSRE